MNGAELEVTSTPLEPLEGPLVLLALRLLGVVGELPHADGVGRGGAIQRLWHGRERESYTREGLLPKTGPLLPPRGRPCLAPALFPKPGRVVGALHMPWTESSVTRLPSEKACGREF